MILLSVKIPGAPVGKGRPRITTIGGHARAFTPKKTRDWEDDAAQALAAPWDRVPYEGPVEVRLVAVGPRPSRLNRKKDPAGRMWRVSKPDIDNVAKAALDALVLATVIKDDIQVVRLVCESVYAAKGEEPCVEVTMLTVSEQP